MPVTLVAALLLVAAPVPAAQPDAAVPTGTFAGEFHRSEGKKSCRTESAKRLTLSIDENGGVEWVGYSRETMACPSMGPVEPYSCWFSGRGVVQTGSAPNTFTIESEIKTRVAAAAGSPNRLWECGSVSVELPAGVEPEGCTALGFGDNHEAANGSQVACSMSEDFGELVSGAFKVSKKGLNIPVTVIRRSTMALARVAASPTPLGVPLKNDEQRRQDSIREQNRALSTMGSQIPGFGGGARPQ